MIDQDKPRICQVLGVEEFERICEAVHNGWWDEKKRQGVSDHPDMIPYDELVEDVKEYDRVTVRRVLDALGIRYESKPRFSEEEVAAAQMFSHAYPHGRIERCGPACLLFQATPTSAWDEIPPKLFLSLLPGQSIALEEIVGD